MPTHRCKHICKPHKPKHKPKLAKELPPFQRTEEFQNFFPTLLKNKTPDTQTDNGHKLNKDNGLQTRWTRTPAHNS